MQIKKQEWLTVTEGAKVLYGYDQDWYEDSFKRTRGCGPTVAAMMLSYIDRREEAGLPLSCGGMAEARAAMALTWQYFTPTYAFGLYSTRLFAACARKFCRAFLPGWSPRRLPVGLLPYLRPAPDNAADFIQSGLASDCPVAFLNLHKGACHTLDSWHWTVIVALNGGQAICFDNGEMKTFDLALWLATSRLGGGFCYVEKQV